MRRWGPTAGIATTLGLLALLALAPRPPVDNSIGALLETDGAPAQRYREFQTQFGTDELVLLRFEGPNLEALLRHAREAQDVLQGSEAVEHVVGPWQAFPELCEALVDPVARDLLEADALTHTLGGPLSKTLPLLERSPPAATVIGFGRTTPVEVRATLRDGLERVRAEANEDGVRLLMAGPPLLNLYLDEAGRSVERTALPLLLIIAIGLLLFTLRRVSLTVLLLLPVGLGVGASDALLGLSGGSANVMVNVVKPLLFVLLLAAGLHVVVRFVALRREGVEPQDAAWVAARDKARPTGLALLTTAIGFGSLTLSDVAPIQVFGALSAAGLLVGVPATLLVLPTLLMRFARGAPPVPRSHVDGLATRLVRFGLAHPRLAIGSGLVVLAAGAAAAPRLGTEPHAIRYFEADHPLRADYEALEAGGLGLSSLEVVLTSTAPWRLDAATLSGVEALRASTTQMPGVVSALALPLVLREASHQVRRQDSLPEAAFAAEALRARPGQARLLLSEDGRHLRLALLIETLDAAALDRLESALADATARHVPGVQVTFTGSYALLLRAQRSLLTTLRDSLLTTLLLMELVLLLVLRRFGATLVALVPNLAPVFLNFVVMALAGIPVDLGTSMTAAVALGIAVDDTLHVAVSWDPDQPEAVAARAGRAIVLSSVVIGLGFLALTTSSFGPTKSFGLLAGLAMITALFGDLVVLPPLLRWVDGRAGTRARGA